MAEAISLEMGAPIDFSTQLQAGTGASHIKSYIKVLKSYPNNDYSNYLRKLII